jgi:hypothetical protein
MLLDIQRNNLLALCYLPVIVLGILLDRRLSWRRKLVSTPNYFLGGLAKLQTARYHSAYIAMLVGYSVKLAMVIVLYIYMHRCVE